MYGGMKYLGCDFHAWFMRYDVGCRRVQGDQSHHSYLFFVRFHAHVRCKTEKWRDVNQGK